MSGIVICLMTAVTTGRTREHNQRDKPERLQEVLLHLAMDDQAFLGIRERPTQVESVDHDKARCEFEWSGVVMEGVYLLGEFNGWKQNVSMFYVQL